MYTLEEMIQQAIAKRGEDSPVVKMYRKQLAAKSC